MEKIIKKNWLMLLALFIALIILLCTTSDDITRSGNETSRLATVECAVDHGIFSIDKSRFHTVDKGKIDGVFYSDKPILYPFFLTTIYYLIHSCGMSFNSAYHDVIYFLNFWGSGIFLLLIMLFMYMRLAKEDSNPFLPVLLSFLGVFSTWLFSYGGIINNHLPAAFFALILYLCLEKWGESKKSYLLAGAGLSAVLLFCLELPTGFFYTIAGGVFVLVKAERRKRIIHATIYSLFFLVPLALTGAVNIIVHGNPLPMYMVPGVYDFTGNIHSRGTAGLRCPENPLLYAWDISLGSRGFFSYMPAFLLLCPAVVMLRKWLKNSPAPYFGGATVILFVFYLFMTGDYGGWAYGCRFLIQIIPVLWLWLAIWIIKEAGKWWRTAFFLLVAVGIFTSMVGAYNPWPVCSYKNRKLVNSFKNNMLCASYEYFPNSPAYRFAENMMGDVNMPRYLPLAFHNMRKIDRGAIKQMPVKIKPRRTIAQNLADAFLPKIKFILPTLAGLVFIWLVTVSSARLIALILARERLLLRLPEAIFLLIPIAIIQIIWIVLFCGITGIGLWSFPFLVCAFIVYIILRYIRPEPAIVVLPQISCINKTVILLCIPAIIAGVVYISNSLLLPPWSYDVLTYHLYIPWRWFQEQSFMHVPTVFGDNAAAFAPKNWLLLAVSWFSMLPGDSVIPFVTVISLIYCASAVFLLCRECGATRKTALFSGILILFNPLLFEYSIYAQPDILSCALLISSVYWLIRRMRENDKHSVLFAGICGGLALGMKTAMIPYVFLPLFIMFVTEVYKKKWLALLVLISGVIVSGGGWFLYNFIEYNNPLFPLEMKFAGVTFFAGAYGTEAVREGEFYARSFGDLLKTVYNVYGGLFLASIPVGFLGWLLMLYRKRINTGSVIVLVHFVFWLIVYTFIIPHNLQTRFLFPCLILGIAGIPLLFREGRMELLSYLIVAILLISFISFCIKRDIILSGGLRIVTMQIAILIFIALSAFIYYLKSSSRARQIISGGICALIIIVLLTQATMGARNRRGHFYQRLTGFSGVNAINGSENFPKGNIAYTGFNRPYLFTGPDYINKVVYCNVQGKSSDNFYDYWSKDKKLYDYHKTNLYRDKPDFQKWLHNLKKNNIKYIFIAPMGLAERRYLRSDEHGYPFPEIDWLMNNPSLFREVKCSGKGKIYKVDLLHEKNNS